LCEATREFIRALGYIEFELRVRSHTQDFERLLLRVYLRAGEVFDLNVLAAFLRHFVPEMKL
jgi:hypothetical protein